MTSEIFWVILEKEKSILKSNVILHRANKNEGVYLHLFQK